jgi:hypothetical protein
MNNHITFLSWLEGFLDATKNKLTAPQIREIRKKIDEVKRNTPKPSSQSFSLDEDFEIYAIPDVENNPEVNDEFLKEIERRKNASTMEELGS